MDGVALFGKCGPAETGQAKPFAIALGFTAAFLATYYKE